MFEVVSGWQNQPQYKYWAEKTSELKSIIHKKAESEEEPSAGVELGDTALAK